jgi:hypothetical protein
MYDMKKLILGLTFIMVSLFAGCTNFQLEAEIGSEWVSVDPEMQITIDNGNLGLGTLQIDEESVPIKCHFGPSKTGFIVYENCDAADRDYVDGDAWLFKGDYSYDENAGTITIDLYGDQIGLGVQQIVLHEKTDN